MASDTTTASFIYKRKYAGKRPTLLSMRYHPTLQRIAKKDGFNGYDSAGTFWYSVIRANPQGVGTFAGAQSVSGGSAPGGASSGNQFGAQQRFLYGVINLAGPAVRKAKGNDGAFLDLVTMESEGIFREMGDTCAFQLQGDGYAARGQRASASTDVITLAVADTARNFKEGMVVVASPNADGTSPRSGSTYIVKVDEDAGTIELNSAAAISSFADNDYLFRSGETAADGTVIDGMESIIPLTAPGGSDSFRSVNRSVNPTRLAGRRLNDTTTSIEENAGLVAVKVGQSGKRATDLALNPVKFWEVVRRLNAKVEYDDGGGTAGYGFEYFKIATPAGTLMAYSDADVPTNRGRVLNPADWEWKHLGSPWIHEINDDKKGFFLRKDGADAIEGRVITEGNVICWDPAAQGVFAI